MTKDDWYEQVARVCELWPNSPMSPTTADAAFPSLSPFPTEQVAVAIETLFREGREFPPPPSMIYGRLVELGETLPDWSNAWGEIKAAISRHGRYANPTLIPWTDADLGALVIEIGWDYLCSAPLGDLPTIEAQARRKFEDLGRRLRFDRAVAGLPPAGLPRLEAALERYAALPAAQGVLRLPEGR